MLSGVTPRSSVSNGQACGAYARLIQKKNMTLRICVRSKGGVNWMGAALYTQNLVKAVTMYAADEGSDVTVVMPSRFIDRAALKACKELAARVPIIPRRALNPWRYDFVYPEIAGKRAPYCWGAWIPDLQEIHLTQLFTEEDRALRARICENAASAAPVIVFSSDMAKRDFLGLYPGTESRCEILNFTSLPAPEWTQGDPIEIQRKYNLPDRFFLVSNQFWKHKDHHAVISALEILAKQGQKPIVACTGATNDYRDPDFFKTIEQRVAELGIQEQFRILGLIPRLDQIQLMRRSLAVIQPSLFEGWSTVVEDSRSLGKIVLLSDFPVHVEQNPPGARYFPQGDAETLAETMLKAWLELSPGPDIAVEAAAVERAIQATVAYGKRFVDIARGAARRESSTQQKPGLFW